MSLSALLFLAGFPVAIGLAWFFEITDAGVRLAARIEADNARMRELYPRSRNGRTAAAR